MTLTPMDIHNKEFNRSFRGYNEDQVDEFLEEVFNEFKALIGERDALEEQLAELRSTLKHYQDLENTLNKSLVVAQQTAEEVKENARKEAELIIKEAEAKAERILAEGMERLEKAYREFDHLKKQMHLYKTRMRTMIQTQLEVLNEAPNGDGEHEEAEGQEEIKPV